MFCTRKIELRSVASTLPTFLIPREVLADYTQARNLIEHAQAQAQELIRQAETQCESVREKAGHEFLQQANAQLQRWESERQAMHDMLEQTAASVINAAIRTLLDETVPAQRLTALLNKLLDAQQPPIKATLLCHPLDREHLEQWLGGLRDVPWTLRAVKEIAPQSLVLETDDGGFHINWPHTLGQLISASSNSTIK
jgi:type III secretion protein L